MFFNGRKRMANSSKRVKTATASLPPSNSAIDIATPTLTPSRFEKLIGKLKHVKGVIVAIAGVGAVASGLLGYYSSYKTVSTMQAISSGSASTIKAKINSKSIAVLPFVNMSSDKDQEYFSDGISEELLNQLAQIHELKVIARTSSFAFKGKEIGIAEIAKILNVAHILEGSIRKSGNQIRITAQLINTADSSHLWSQTYDRDMTNIFAVQDEISAAVVEQLKLKLLDTAPKAKVAKPEAYTLHLRARSLIRLHTAKDTTEAIVLLKQALKIDPDYAAAWEQLAIAYNLYGVFGTFDAAEGSRLAREAANRALELDPLSGLAHAALGNIAQNYDHDLSAAALHLSRAMVLAPNEFTVLRACTTLVSSLGRADDAIVIAEALAELDPANPLSYGLLGLAYLKGGRLDAAIANFRKVLALTPGSGLTHHQIGKSLLLKGSAPEAALAEMQLEPAEEWRLIGLPMAWHALGNKAKSDAALAELIRKFEKGAAYNIAYVYAYRGEADKAFEWLEKAITYHDAGLSLIVLQEEFVKLHTDPRWLPFMRKIGRAPEQLAAIKFEVKLPAK